MCIFNIRAEKRRSVCYITIKVHIQRCSNTIYSALLELYQRAGVLKWAGTRYLYPSEIVHSTVRNYWIPPPKKKICCGQNHKYDTLVEYFSYKINDHVNCWILAFKSNNCVTTKLMRYLFPVLKINLPWNRK